MGYGETREHARRRVVDALRRYAVLGLRTNLWLLKQIVEHPRFVEGSLDTALLDREPEILEPIATSETGVAIAAAIAASEILPSTGAAPAPPTAPTSASDPCSVLQHWRITGRGRDTDQS